MDPWLPYRNRRISSRSSGYSSMEDEEGGAGARTSSPVQQFPQDRTLQRQRPNQFNISNRRQGASPNNFGGVATVPAPGMMRSVSVQMTFNGPSSTFVSVFRQPGNYRINMDFQSQQPSQQRSQSGSRGGSQPVGQTSLPSNRNSLKSSYCSSQ